MVAAGIPGPRASLRDVQDDRTGRADGLVLEPGPAAWELQGGEPATDLQGERRGVQGLVVEAVLHGSSQGPEVSRGGPSKRSGAASATTAGLGRRSAP